MKLTGFHNALIQVHRLTDIPYFIIITFIDTKTKDEIELLILTNSGNSNN